MKKPVRRITSAALLAALCLGPANAFAETPAAAPAPAAPKPALRTQLPDETPYQKALRAYLGTLTAKDFEHGIAKDAPKPTAVSDPDELFRTWLLTLEFPRVGRKRSYPALNTPAEQFTLAHIESKERGVIRPACWPEPTAWIADWKYEGNPYFGSRAVKLRAFATITVMMLMHDDLQRHPTGPKDTRTDWFGTHLIAYGYTYLKVKDVLPAEAREAYLECLKAMMQRVTQWGPRGDETHFDIATMLGMRLAADAIGDAASKKVAEDFAHKIMGNPWYYNNDGYFPDQGCLDAGYQGMSMYWGTWLALAAPDWTFISDAVKRSWKLRGYLLLPEPDGTVVGPSHFNSRTSSDALNDQWEFPFKFAAGAILTDDAAAQAKYPDAETLQAAPQAVIGELRSMTAENPGYNPDEKIVSHPWAWNIWPDSGQFPMNNFAQDYYTKGYFAKREALNKSNSPLTKLPFAREGSFTETFGKTFLFAKRAAFGVAVHTGVVSQFQGEGHGEYNGPYGLGGGTLSAFWTPSTGSVLLGRRGGMRISGPTAISNDKPEAWRTWPVHAVSGVTAGGKFFTSARIQTPDSTYDIQGKSTTVNVKGVMPEVTLGTEKAIEGKIDYARRFTVEENALSVETTVSGDGKDSVAELYEVLPVFLREASRQQKAVPTTIEFEVGGKWAPATAEATADVRAVRLTRFEGAVEIRFDRARRAKLSPEDWKDTYLSAAQCRNVLVDLLENNDQATGIKDAKKIAYRIAPVKKP